MTITTEPAPAEFLCRDCGASWKVQLARHATREAEHVAWSTSNRKSRLPSNWVALRNDCLKRANNRCEWIRVDTEQRCNEPANQADHIIPGDDHSQLQALCEYHHRVKSSSEGGTAASARRKAAKKRRHPGLLP